MKRLIAPRARALLLALAALCAVGCDGSDRPVVVLYVSADDYVARDVVAAFEAEHDIDVQVVGDTEAQKTTGLVERLRREADAPVADVFWSSEIFHTIDLAEEGVLAPYDVPALTDWPEAHRDADRRWYAFAARARVIVYHPERVPEPPTRWTELAQRPRFKDRIVMADPRFGTTGGHLGAMKAFWDRHAMAQYYEVFIEKLAENGTRMLTSGNAGVVQSIIDGDADVGLTDTDDVWAARARGHDLGMVYPSHLSVDERHSGTLLIPNTVALVAGAPHPDTAGVLIEYLLSEAVERRLAESTSHNIPLRPGLAAEYPDLDPGATMRIDFADAAEARAGAVAMAMETFARRDDAAGE